MAYSYDPICVQSIGNFAAKTTSAKTTMDDNTNAVLAFTAGAQGALIKRLKARALGTNNASVAYAFTSSDSGTTLRMKAAKDAAAQTISTTAGPNIVDLGPTEAAPWRLLAGERLYIAMSVALAAGWVFEGDYEQL